MLTLVLLGAAAADAGRIRVAKEHGHRKRSHPAAAALIPPRQPSESNGTHFPWLEEQPDSPAVPSGIAPEDLETLKTFFKGVPRGHPDRLIIEMLDYRIDEGATVVMATAMAAQIRAMIEDQGTEKPSPYFWNRACNFRIPEQYGEEDCFVACDREDDMFMPPKGGLDSSDTFCYKGKASRGGSFMTSVALANLDPEKHHFAISASKHMLRLNNRHENGIHTATGFEVDQGPAFTAVSELRLLRVDGMIQHSCDMLATRGPHCAEFEAEATLAFSAKQQRMKAICTDCIVGATNRLQSLPDDAEPKEMESLAAEFEKWSHALRCATHEGFPECLPKSVFDMYKCNIELSEDCAGGNPNPKELEEEIVPNVCSSVGTYQPPPDPDPPDPEDDALTDYTDKWQAKNPVDGMPKPKWRYMEWSNGLPSLPNDDNKDIAQSVEPKEKRSFRNSFGWWPTAVGHGNDNPDHRAMTHDEISVMLELDWLVDEMRRILIRWCKEKKIETCEEYTPEDGEELLAIDADDNKIAPKRRFTVWTDFRQALKKKTVSRCFEHYKEKGLLLTNKKNLGDSLLKKFKQIEDKKNRKVKNAGGTLFNYDELVAIVLNGGFGKDKDGRWQWEGPVKKYPGPSSNTVGKFIMDGGHENFKNIVIFYLKALVNGPGAEEAEKKIYLDCEYEKFGYEATEEGVLEYVIMGNNTLHTPKSGFHAGMWIEMDKVGVVVVKSGPPGTGEADLLEGECETYTTYEPEALTTVPQKLEACQSKLYETGQERHPHTQEGN